MKRLMVVSILFILLTAACGPHVPSTPPLATAPSEPTQTSSPAPVDQTPAQQAAIQALARSLGLSLDQIAVVSSEAVQWPDSCLGVSRPYLMCAQIVTPGYLISLQANGQQYEYHTNQDGSSIIPATLALTWQREGGIASFCDSLKIYLSGEVYSSSCKAGGTMKSLGQVLSADQLVQFKDWMTKYGRVNLDASNPPGTADGMQIKLSLNGTGDQQPTQAEQQSLLDWAQAVYNQLSQKQ